MALELALAQRAATVVLNFAVAVAVGAAATRFWAGRVASPWAQRQDRRARRTGIASLAVAMIASAGVLWLEAAAMAEVPVMQAGVDAWTMLTATHFGTAWQIGIVALVVGFAAMALASPRRRGTGWTFASMTGIAVFLYTRSMVSHASADGDFSVAMIVDSIHLLLICLWVGEVVVSGLVVLPSLPGEDLASRADCSRYVESLSTSATVALIGIFVTGLVNAWYNLGSPKELLGNPYGAALTIKLTLVLAAAMLGGMNRFFIMPRLIAGLRGAGAAPIKDARRFTLILRLEALVLLAVLTVAAILSATSPPAAG